MFKDSTGAVSTMRVCMFMIVVTICSIYIFQNIASIAHGHGLVSLSMTEVSALGVAFAAKFGQTFTEKSEEKPPVEGEGN